MYEVAPTGKKEGEFSGVAVCFQKDFLVQPLGVTLPQLPEMMFFKIWAHHLPKLSCVCYHQ